MKLVVQLCLIHKLLCFIVFTFFCLQLNAQLNANFTASQNQGCSPLVIKFTDASAGNPAEWNWNLGNGATSDSANASAIYINPGTYIITLTVKNAANPNGSVKTDSVIVFPNPNVSFSASPLSGCAPLNVSFKDASTPGAGFITGWIWDFGDGITSSNQNPMHTYNNSDTFNVDLSVTNSFGCTQIVQNKGLIKIGDLVEADFGYTYSSICKPPATVTFSNKSISKSTLTYQWNFGDGLVSTDAKPIHAYNTSGNFTVTLTARNASGCTSIKQETISVGAARANFSYSSACINNPVLFTDSSSPKPLSGTWNFGDGTTITGDSILHTFNGAGPFQVSYTANFGSCTDEIKKTVYAGQKPTAAFTVNGTKTSCFYPLAINFNNTSTGATSYQWLFGDGDYGTGTNPQHVYNRTGQYTVTLIAFNASGCADTLVENNLIQIGPPKIYSIDGLPFQGCAPRTIILRPSFYTPDSNVTYKWNLGDGTTSTDAVPKHTYTKVGSYDVSLIITTKQGCADTVTFPAAVLIGQKPTASFNAQPLKSCANELINFNSTSTGLITNWFWVFGDGGTSASPNPDYQYKDTGYFPVTLIVSEFGCADTLTIPKYVYLKPPVARFGFSSGCKNPFNYNFTDSSIAPKTWLWTFGDNTTSISRNPSHAYADTGKFALSLTVTNDECTYTKYDTINVVHETPVINYKMASYFCKYDSVQLYASKYNPANITAFYWNFGDSSTAGFDASLDTVFHQYLSAGNFSPSLIVQDIHDCLDTIHTPLVNLKVYGPSAAFSNKTGGCPVYAVTFNDESSPDGLHPIKKWIWNYGDNSKPDTLTAPPFIHNYINTGNYNVYLKVEDSIGCYDTVLNNDAVEVTQPVASFNADSLLCKGSDVMIRDSSVGFSISYKWDFGDGFTSANPLPQHAYKANGIFTLKLIVTDKYGCADTLIRPGAVTISSPLAAFMLADTLFNCPPTTITPANNSVNYSAVNWDFGDGNTSPELNPTHIYTTSGLYNIRLVAQGYGTTCYDTITKNIVLKGPKAKLRYDSAGGCNPLTVSLSASAKNTSEYIWDYGNGVTETSKDSSKIYTYTTTGRFLPQLIVVDSGGCRVPVVNADTITVFGANAKFGISQTATNCDSVTVNFTDSSTALYDSVQSYKWNFDDNRQASLLQNPAHIYTASGSYHPSLSITTGRGCASTDTLPLNITVVEKPNISATIPDSACVQSSLNLFAKNADSLPNITWHWNFGDGNTSNNQNPSYIYTTPGKYQVNIIANAAAGCADTLKSNLTVSGLPVIDAGKDSVLCLGETEVLQPAGGVTYQWLAEPTLSCADCTNPVAKPTSSTTYFVTGSNSAGCKATDSLNIQVKQPLTVAIAAPDSLCIGGTVQLSASGEELYNWQPVNLVAQPTAAQTSSTPVTTTTYTVSGTDSKHCFTSTASKTVYVFPNPTFGFADSTITIEGGSSYKITGTGSNDIVAWQWMPPGGLSCNNCPQPVATPRITTIYNVQAQNAAGCTVNKSIIITVVCKNENLFIPNTFSPNNDGMNDYFYPRGKGFTIKSFRIFSRWGSLVYEQHNFAPNIQSTGWNGTFNGKELQPDVYVYMIDVICDNGTLISSKGDVTLLR